VNEKHFPPTGDPGGKALRDCALVHEECHVSSPKTVCPENTLDLAGVEGDTSEEECKCYKKEVKCLNDAKQSCKGNADCISKILKRIEFIVKDSTKKYNCKW